MTTKILLFIWKKIIDHLVGAVIATIFTTSFILEIFTKIKPLTQLVIPFLMWKWSGWIALLVILATLWIRNEITKRRVIKQGIVQKPPKYYASHDKRVKEREFDCPECDYELERKNTNWYCMPCKKYYKIPKELRENTWEKIRRNYQRLVVQWGYNNFGISEDDHKPFRVVLRNIEKEKKRRQREI